MKRVYTNQEIERLFWAEKEGLPSRLVVWAENPAREKKGAFQTLITLAGKIPTALELEKSANSFDPAITATDITMCKLLSAVEIPTARTVTEEVLRELAVYSAPLNWGNFSYGEVRDLLSAFRTWEEGNRQDFESENVQRELINSIEKKLREIESKRVIFEGVESVASSTGFEPVYRDEERIPQPMDGMDIFDKIVVSEALPYAQYRAANGVFYYKVFKGRGAEDLPNFGAIVLNSAPHDVPYLEVGIPSNTTIEPDVIYMSLWLGQGRMQEATKSTFHQVTYDLRENTLAVEAVIGVETQDMERARGRLEAAFPHLSLGPEKEVKVRGEFYVALDLDETVLYHLILNSWLANLFYAEESTRPAALKRRLTLNYRSLFYEELRIRSKKTGLEPPPAATVTLFAQPSRPGVYKAVIGRTRNNAHLQDFLNIFSLALAYYLERKEEISALYYSMLPELAEISKLALLTPPDQGGVERAQAVSRAKKKIQRGVTTIKQLQEKFGKFTLNKNFARDCQGEHQPEIVPPEELEAARRETFLSKESIGGRIYREIAPRQIMPFPNAQDPQVHLICRSDKFPYPGLTPNKDDATKKEYPCVFCCYENDQTSKKRYIQCANMKEGAIRAANSYIVSGKMLQERQFGAVPSDILQLLGAQSRLERPDRRAAYSDRLNRYGVVRSPSSFLHCILRAVGDAEYNLAITKGAEERTALNLRRELAQYLRQYPDLVRQELYDREDGEIVAELEDPEAFLDPLHYYRLLEEFFNINIFIFSNEGKGDILVPRFKLFRAQVKQMRYSALVIRNRGAESDKLTYPQCELIVGRQEGGENDNFSPVALFDEDEAGNACYQALIQACSVFSFTPYSYPIVDIHSIPRYLSIPTPEVQALIPGYEEGTAFFFNNAITYEVDFSAPKSTARENRVGTYLRPISQVVDSSGKLRALIFRLKDGSDFSIITFPSQPGALPRHRGPLPRLSASKTIAVLGQPLFYKAHGEIEIDGVTVDWVFGLCYKNVFHPDIVDYVPVDDVEDGPYRPADLIDYLRPEEADWEFAPLFDRAKVEEGIYSNFLESEPEIPRTMTERIRHLSRTMKLILALVRWLYELEKARGVDEPGLFAESFLRYVDAPIKDSANFYNFKRLQARLPSVSSALEAIKLMSKVAPTFFAPEGFLLMYSQEMNRRVASYIFEYHRKTFSLHGNPPLYIEDFFTQSEDFTPHPGVAVFCGTQMLHEWLKSLRVSYEIREKVDFSLAMVLSPSLYLAPAKRNRDETVDDEVEVEEISDRDFYLIQSVAVSGDATGGADLATALYLAAAWEKTGENLGAEIRISSASVLSPEEIAQAFGDYTVFKIGADSQPEEIQRVGEGRLKILRFRTGKASEDENLTTLNYTEGARKQASFFAALLPIRDR